uniref:Tectonic-1-3 N-terminal domain-containing protein n=1 Tax=Anopheles culicifacies TaxID=139723 RepID=A0A182MWC4_9DIPT
MLAPCIDGGGERNIQHFVKIDVAKINTKNTTDTIGNASTTTLTSELVTETSTTTSSTTEGTTTSVSSTPTTTSKSSATEATVAVESTATTSTSTATPTTESSDAAYPPFKSDRAAKLVPKGYYCRCDLTINLCDINCCCDIDCNAAIMRTYSCDQEELHTDEYHHGEGLQSCRVQGGLFCLVEPIYEEGDDSYYNPGKLRSATRHKWKEVFPLDSTATSDDIRYEHYRVDDVIYVYNETSEMVQLFALPTSLTGTVCSIEQPVRFLRDHVNLCLRTVDELSEFNRAFVRQAASSSVRFFRAPKKSNVMEHYCVAEGDCLNATISVCYYSAGDGWNCTMGTNLTDATVSADEMIQDDPGTVCRELEILFFHNYTNLQRIEMKLLCRADNSDRTSDGELWMDIVWQRITVKFIVPSASASKAPITRAVSGNIGYLVGKPLIVSHLEPVANGTIAPDESPSETPPKRMLAYFTNGTRLPDPSFRLRIPISQRNRCVLTEEFHQTVDFGTDMFHRCNYIPPDLSNQTTGSVQNYTKFCQDLQLGLYAQLLHGIEPDMSRVGGYDKLNLYVSKYGNPINRTSEWVRVRSTNVILEAEPGSDSSPNTDTTDSYFTCSNMLINVEYRFYYARTRVRDVRQQAVVHDAEVVFGPRVNLRFRLDEEIRVPIFIQVQFFDLTSSSVTAASLRSDGLSTITGKSSVCVIAFVRGLFLRSIISGGILTRFSTRDRLSAIDNPASGTALIGDFIIVERWSTLFVSVGGTFAFGSSVLIGVCTERDRFGKIRFNVVGGVCGVLSFTTFNVEGDTLLGGINTSSV